MHIRTEPAFDKNMKQVQKKHNTQNKQKLDNQRNGLNSL